VGGPVRHAQYRQELADQVHNYAGPVVALERSDASPTLPALTVRWTGSRLSRTAIGGWTHSYDVEIRVGERGVELDGLVAAVSNAVADWQPFTSRATASPPDVKPVQVFDGDINYPAVLVSTVVTEPSTA
jgi:hypothetical protein